MNIVGINGIPFSVYPTEDMVSGRIIPFTQDNNSENVWETWDVEWRDVYIMDAFGQLVDKINLTQFNPDPAVNNGQNYELLKSKILDARNHHTYGNDQAPELIGDWDGDGDSDAGRYETKRNGRINGYLDLNDDSLQQRSERFTIRKRHATPVAIDWNNDGTTDIGWYKKGRLLLDTNGDHRLEGKRDKIFKLASRDYTKVSVVDANQDGQNDLVLRSNKGDQRYSAWTGQPDTPYVPMHSHSELIDYMIDQQSGSRSMVRRLLASI